MFYENMVSEPTAFEPPLALFQHLSSPPGSKIIVFFWLENSPLNLKRIPFDLKNFKLLFTHDRFIWVLIFLHFLIYSPHCLKKSNLSIIFPIFCFLGLYILLCDNLSILRRYFIKNIQLI